MATLRRPFLVLTLCTLLIVPLALGGCTLSGSGAAPVTPFEPPTAEIPLPTAIPTIDVFATQTAVAASAMLTPSPADIGILPVGTVDPNLLLTPGAVLPTVDPLLMGTPGTLPTVAGLPTALPTVAPAAATPVPATPSAAETGGGGACPSSYTVKAGDNLFRIALQYDLEVADIASANGITNTASLSVGQVLRLPGCTGATSGAGTAGGTTHTVAAGETLYRIALRYGLTYQELASYNGITDPTAISIGQVLRIP
ncbi:MAG: LysM peptidoglycan-binding domain-containing protein [Anaerolineae bacterium]|nr:LysM peptidoglycan-binding domain-containing protein [Anaerolineae bacterium]